MMRHGETVWNAENRILGSTDIPLNENGREQARKAAEELALKMARKASKQIAKQQKDAETITDADAK